MLVAGICVQMRWGQNNSSGMKINTHICMYVCNSTELQL